MPEAIDLFLKELNTRLYKILSTPSTTGCRKILRAQRYLSGLCEQEVADRYQKRVLRWPREACLLAGKSFINLILTELNASVQQQVIALKEPIDWAHRAGNV